MRALAFALFLTAMATAAFGAEAAPTQSYLEAPGPLGPLKGTMLSPALGKAPVVLIVPGSGAIDRDGDSGPSVKASSYRLLAEGLADRGLASVRIDKRGMFASGAAVVNANDVTLSDYADDVHAWIKTIRSATGQPCVWVLGHSEGGLVALAAAQTQKDICGLILVAAAGRPVGEVLREQLNANPANAPYLQGVDAAITDLEAGRRVDVSTLNPALQPLFSPKVQGLENSEFGVDPTKLIADYKGPVLILQGDRDLQVSVADAERLKTADPRAELTILPRVNHMLKTVTGDTRAANLATYADPSLPLATGVVEAVSRFVTAHQP
jgi:pimeloyl-ACP methyl ester carboxylesterase